MKRNEGSTVSKVRNYWQSHTLGKQYVTDNSIEPGSKEFFDHIRPWMTPYKFPEIMPRIDQEAKNLMGKQLLEIGCGMGFDSVEFLKRQVKVTATDLTPAAVDFSRRHFEIENLVAEDVRVENALDLSFEDETFDAVWACGVLHHTGNTEKAIREIRRVLKPGGRAVISHLYRKPSWMYYISKYGRENIEFKEEDAPITDFATEQEFEAMFDGYDILSTYQDHYRLLPIARTGFKAFLYTWILKPIYNLLPEKTAKKLAYKYSIVAVKK